MRLPASLKCLLWLAPLSSLHAAIFTVNNSNDSGAGSLRQALIDANATVAADTINFNTAGHFSVPRTITVASALSISEAITIDAPAAAGQKVTISGGNAVQIMGINATPAATMTLRNLTFQDGRKLAGGLGGGVPNGGGILVTSAQTVARFEGCTISGCFASGSGGAIYCSNGTVILDTCTLSGNEATTGGGLYLEGTGTATITQSTFFANNANVGAGIASGDANCTCTATNTLFSLNSAVHNGGGLYFYEGADLTLTSCTFSANSAIYGAGAYLEDFVGADVLNCVFANNTAAGQGGGMSSAAADLYIYGSTFSGNNAAHGAGLFTRSFGASALANCTFSGNSSSTFGGGLNCTDTAVLDLRNCTVAGNSAPTGSGMYCGIWSNARMSNTIVASNTGDANGDISGGVSSDGHNLIGLLPPGGGFSASLGDLVGRTAAPIDPMLGPLQNNGGSTQTRALLTGSPAIEAGDEALVVNPPFQAPPYLDQRSQSRVSGNTVDIGAFEYQTLEVLNTTNAAAGSLRDIITQANLVGGGVISFKKSVFNASKQTVSLTSGQIAITSNLSILAPDVGVKIDAGSNSRIFNITAGPVALERLEFAHGTSTADGGALRVAGGTTSVTLMDCQITNSSALSGGGLYIESGATVKGMNCAFTSNTATGGGGGGIHMVGAASVFRLTNSTIAANSATGEGAGFFHEAGTSTLLNCTVADNIADSNANEVGNGGGIIRSAGTANLGNTIVANNTDSSPTQGNKHPDISGTFVSLGHNLIGKNNGGAGFTNAVNGDQVGAIGNPRDPLLAALSGTYYLLNAGSPALNAGDNALLDQAAWLETPEYDQRGQFRTVNTIVDIGSVEGPSGAVVRLSVIDGNASEQNLDVAKFRLRRSLSNGTSMAVSLNIDAASTASSSDYALSGPSYQPSGPSGILMAFPLNDAAITLTVTPTQDTFVEGTETVSISLTGIGYGLDSGDPGSRVIDIHDNEFTVTSNANTGTGSLRKAINDANDAGGGKITIPTPLSIALGGAPLSLTEDVEIVGNASTVTAAGLSRVFELTGTGCVTLNGLTLTGGKAPAGQGGGGLLVQNGCLFMRDCAVTSNQCDGDGGGLLADNSNIGLTIVNTSFDANTAGGDGGGLASITDTTLTNVTLSKNTARDDGGGAALPGAQFGPMIFTNCTLTENTADSDNSSVGNGGGLFWPSGALTLNNTVISGNFDTPANAGSGTMNPNVSTTTGTVTTGGGNFIGQKVGAASLFTTGSPNASGDYVGSSGAPLDAKLVGQTDLRRFYSFSTTSLLANHGVNALNTEPNDIRGRTRIVGVAIDIGAVEMNSFAVTNTNDTGVGSFRQTILNANTAGGGDIIFEGNLWNTAQTITLTSGEILVTSAIDVMAPGLRTGTLITLQPPPTGRLLKIAPTSATNIILRNLSFIGGNTTTNAVSDRLGGTLHTAANANVTLRQCVMAYGTSPSDGGNIFVAVNASLAAYDSEIYGGVAIRGGNLCNNGTLNLERCFLSSSQTTGNGGGLYNTQTATLTNCTLYGNRANGTGGGICHAAGASNVLSLLNCTVNGNVANYDNSGSETGGGIRQISGIAQVKNVLLYNNTLGSPGLNADDLAGSFLSLGHNLARNVTGATGFTNGVNGDLIGNSIVNDFALRPPFDNGGPTYTAALQCGHSAIDAGDSDGAPATDQRGLPRRFGAAVDIGAYELQPESYAYWTSYVFPAGAALTAPSEDYDHDGVPNGIEYLAGSSPNPALYYYQTKLPTPPTIAKFGLIFTVSYPISPMADPASYRVRMSTNLQSWTLAPTTITTGACVPGGVITSFSRTFPVNTKTAFARLEYLSLP